MPDKSTWLLAQGSLKYFTVKFLGHKWPEHYQEWDDMLQKYDRLLVQAPRGHGKSIFWSLAWPLWNVIRGKWEHLIISYSEDQVRRLIRDIRIVVESNPFLEPLRPTTKEIWGTDQLSFANGSFISGLGFGTSSRGRHPNGITVDDPLKDLGGMTDEDQERAYFGVITGMAMEKTKLVTVGTPVNFGDLLEKLEKNDAYARWKRPALNNAGEPLFPHLWSKSALDKRRQEMGSINFSREFLLERVDPATQPFKHQYQTLYQEIPINFARRVTVCDPAYSEGQGDFTAIVTVGFTGGNHAYVLEAKAIRREDPGQIVNELFKTIAAYTPDAVGIEAKKGQALHYSFQERRTRENRWDFSYVELSHGGKGKNDPSRVGGLVPRWEARTIHIHPEMKQLQDQLYAYRLDDRSKQHDDLVDALAYCFHPDMATPNWGKRGLPSRSEGKTLFHVGRRAPERTHPLSPSQELWKRLDRRVSDSAAA